MRTTLGRIVAFVAIAFFLLYGVAFSLFPEDMSLLVTGSKPEGVSALIDFRATYGGMTIAVGAALAYLYAIGQVRACLVTIALVLFSMAATRSVGLLVHGSGNAMMYVYPVLEILGGVLALLAMRKTID